LQLFFLCGFVLGFPHCARVFRTVPVLLMLFPVAPFVRSARVFRTVPVLLLLFSVTTTIFINSKQQ
jgi:hypothetical protein